MVNRDISLEEFDNFWHIQNQVNANKNQFTENRYIADESSEDLSSSSYSRSQHYQDEEPFAGAYDGIMSIRDDPKKAGKKDFCGQVIEKTDTFFHREDINRVHNDIDARSEKVSFDVYSCDLVSSDMDSVQQDAHVGT